mgnify:CR=1 FL=1
MAVDLDKLMLHSSYNTFKNIDVQKDTLDLPTAVGAGSIYTDSVTFSLAETAAFMQGYSYATDYGDYFNYLDSQYHDEWRNVHTNNDYMVLSSSGLLTYTIKLELTATSAIFTLRLSREGFGAVTINHPTYLVPIAFIDYRLTN